jgi:glucokinase
MHKKYASMRNMILAGDIGGTNTRLALFENGQRVGNEEKFPSQKYNSLEEIIAKFLNRQKVKKACFGIAGPVRNGKSKVTNVAWEIDAAHIAESQGIEKIFLLNDLEANAYGLRALKEEELFLLHEGVKQIGNQGLIAAGTGLGEAGLFWNGKEHIPFACEGGHTDFAPRSRDEIDLFLYLQKKFGHVSYERVISGPGLVNIFQFLVETKREEWTKEAKEAMGESDPARVISDWGARGKDLACVRALDWFISLYGAEAGNMALKFLALGGFYVGGGIAPHLVQKMKEGKFHASFIDKGRFQKLLASIPIWVVMNDNAALLGAALFAEKFAERFVEKK